MPYKASTKEEIEAKLEEGRNSPNNQPEKKKKKKSETDGRQRGRGKSFRFDDDLFTTLWANHNNYYKDTNTASMSSEEQFKAYHDFVISVFNAHTSAKLAKSAGCKETNCSQNSTQSILRLLSQSEKVLTTGCGVRNESLPASQTSLRLEPKLNRFTNKIRHCLILFLALLFE